MYSKKREIQRQVEEGLGSIGRLRILRVLASGDAASQTKYGLEKATGLKPVDVRKHLKILVRAGWVTEHTYHPAVYTLNLDDPKGQLLRDFFQKVGYLAR